MLLRLRLVVVVIRVTAQRWLAGRVGLEVIGVLWLKVRERLGRMCHVRVAEDLCRGRRFGLPGLIVEVCVGVFRWWGERHGLLLLLLLLSARSRR